MENDDGGASDNQKHITLGEVLKLRKKRRIKFAVMISLLAGMLIWIIYLLCTMP